MTPSSKHCCCGTSNLLHEVVQIDDLHALQVGVFLQLYSICVYFLYYTYVYYIPGIKFLKNLGLFLPLILFSSMQSRAWRGYVIKIQTEGVELGCCKLAQGKEVM